jgi:hypothetical protein
LSFARRRHKNPAPLPVCPPSTLSPLHPAAREAVNWVRDAWVNIQNERTDWLFRIDLQPRAERRRGRIYRRELQPEPVAMASRHGLAAHDEPLRPGRAGPPTRAASTRSAGTSTARCSTAASRPTTGRPIGRQAQRRARRRFASPTRLMSCRGEYRRASQILTLDADVPIIPEEYHGVIVGEALRLMADSDESWEGCFRASRSTTACGRRW